MSAIAGVGILVAFTTAAGANLPDYMFRVSRAMRLAEEIESAYGGRNSASAPGLIDTNVPIIRRELPVNERVQLGNQPVAVNNSWLHELLTDIEHSNDSSRRRALVTLLAARLQALHDRLEEVQKASAANTDKDADKGRLAEILRRPEYIPAPPQSSALERLLQRFWDWLESLMPKHKPLAPGTSSAVSTVAQILVVGLCLAVIAFLIWRFGPRFMQGRRKKKKTREPRIVLGELLDPDQTAADLLAQADALARAGDLRAAIRKAYIALLCELGDRKLISLAQSKTNRDYLYAVRDKVSLYSSMRKLTNSFELHWYGLVPAGENEWNEFRSDYQRTLRIPGRME